MEIADLLCSVIDAHVVVALTPSSAIHMDCYKSLATYIEEEGRFLTVERFGDVTLVIVWAVWSDQVSQVLLGGSGDMMEVEVSRGCRS